MKGLQVPERGAMGTKTANTGARLVAVTIKDVPCT